MTFLHDLNARRILQGSICWILYSDIDAFLGVVLYHMDFCRGNQLGLVVCRARVSFLPFSILAVYAGGFFRSEFVLFTAFCAFNTTFPFLEYHNYGWYVGSLSVGKSELKFHNSILVFTTIYCTEQKREDPRDSVVEVDAASPLVSVYSLLHFSSVLILVNKIKNLFIYCKLLLLQQRLL